MGGLSAREGRRPDAARRLGDGSGRRARGPLRSRALRPTPGERRALGRPPGRHPRPGRPGPPPAAARSVVQEAGRLRDAGQARGGPPAIGPGKAESKIEPADAARRKGRPMTTTRSALVATIDPAAEAALDGLLLSMADDEFVIGFSDSEWTGIAPILEEDIAMSSLAQDELGHARALYELLAEVRGDGQTADTIAYDRQPSNDL